MNKIGSNLKRILFKTLKIMLISGVVIVGINFLFQGAVVGYNKSSHFLPIDIAVINFVKVSPGYQTIDPMLPNKKFGFCIDTPDSYGYRTGVVDSTEKISTQDSNVKYVSDPLRFPGLYFPIELNRDPEEMSPTGFIRSPVVIAWIMEDITVNNIILPIGTLVQVDRFEGDNAVIKYNGGTVTVEKQFLSDLNAPFKFKKKVNSFKVTVVSLEKPLWLTNPKVYDERYYWYSDVIGDPDKSNGLLKFKPVDGNEIFETWHFTHDFDVLPKKGDTILVSHASVNLQSCISVYDHGEYCTEVPRIKKLSIHIEPIPVSDTHK